MYDACMMNVRWCAALVSWDRLGISRLDDLTLHSHKLWHFYSQSLPADQVWVRVYRGTWLGNSWVGFSWTAVLSSPFVHTLQDGTVETLYLGSTQQITGIFFSFPCAIVIEVLTVTVIEVLTHNSVVSCYSRPLMLLLLSSATSALAKKGYGRPFSYLVLTPSLLWDFRLVFLDKSISSGSEHLTNGMTIEHLFRHPEILSMW